ncbi:MAG: Holliday junction branch migration protein RuvA [Microcella sp.]|uniref:Holliday junction branch migration protein RuvA n=1 Tax=Microcella sp. TaxID=1913979 RepID=UPI003314E012
MIASLRGTVVALAASRLVLEVAGVGYALAITERHARELRVGDTVRLHTALVVREDDLSLFGFADEVDLGLFELLRTVSGVGPKSALGVLGSMDADAIARAIAHDDDAPFRAVSGIGPKTAKLIVITLAGKLDAPRTPVRAGASDEAGLDATAPRTALVAALTGLGWPERTALDAAAAVIGDAQESPLPELPVLLRRALAQLGPAR